MATGAPIFLVSACASAEEFVAAFRRYADRTGLFIPMAEPLPAGRTGRLALTLSDGGVMIEGVAQVVTSSAKPVGLYGRPGITVKFVEPDEPSKIVIAELEKARLALRPLAPSVPPRKAEVPASPRPKPAAIIGRIDAANSLAETIAIGDLASLEATAGDPNASGSLPKAGQKFVVPSIPSIGGPSGSPGSGPIRAKTPTNPPERAKTPTNPPERARTPTNPPPERPKTPTKPPEAAKPAEAKPPEAKPADPARTKPPTSPPSASGTAIADALKAAPAEPAPPARARPPTKPPPTPSIAKSKKPTMLGMPIVDKLPVEKLTAGTPVQEVKLTQRGMAPHKAVLMTQPLPIAQAQTKQDAEAAKDDGKDAALIADKPPSREDPTTPLMMKNRADGVKPGLPPQRRPHTPSTPPMPRHPTPAAPLPVARLPAHMASQISADAVEAAIESTDITTVPEPALPEHDAVEPSAAAPAEAATTESGKAELPKADGVPEARPQRSGGMRASEIMAAIPTDDWTMSPDASAPVVLPASAKVPAPAPTAAKDDHSKPITVEAKTVPKGPPTGDWTMQADPTAADGWGSPAKMKKEPPPEAATGKPATGNPVHAISSDKALEIQEWEDKPTGIGQPLVEIDSTLMEPFKPMPALDPLPELSPHDVATAPALRAQTGPAPATPVPQGMLVPSQQPQAGFEHVGTPPPLAPPPLAPQSQMTSPPTPPPSSVMNAATNPGFTGPMPQATGQQPVYPTGVDPALHQQQMQMMGFPRNVSDAGTGFFRDSEPMMSYPADAGADAERQRRKKVLLIAVGSAVAAVTLVVIIIMLTGGKKNAAGSHGKGPGSASVMKVMTGTGSGSGSEAAVGSGSEVEISTGSGSGAGSEEVATPTPTPTPTPTNGCKVEVTTNPPGAQVQLDKDTLGSTPGTFDLPCDAEVKLKIYKAKYFGVIKSVTPTSEGIKVDVTLASAIFTVKVTSAPAGATITVGGKPMGVTPTSIKLPAFAPSTIVISKDGFVADTQKITPKQNGMAHHVPLKKLAIVPPHKK